MKAFLSRQVLQRSLITITLLYACVEWRLAAKISGSSIFSHRRSQEIKEFDSFVEEIAKRVSSECTSGRTSTVLFDDDDVALPYLVNRIARQAPCTVGRETAVTPFSASELDSCSTILIKEQHLPHVPPDKAPPVQDRGLIAESHWASGSNGFSFSVYRRRGCPASGPGA
jgi:hypothetical protein